MDTPSQPPKPTREELLARAAKIVPILREHAAESEEKRQLADASIAALRDAGLFRLLQPRRWGGMEADMRTHIEVVAKIAEGCGSSSWVLGVQQIHSWMAAHFSEAAQSDIYADNPDALVSAVLTPRGKAQKTDGGYLLSGFWPFGSGCNHADWMMLGAMIEGANPPLAEALFLVPIEDVEITGDWHVGGLRGTGSHSVRTGTVFVPEHRHLAFAHAVNRQGPGLLINDAPLYRSAAIPALVFAITGTALGVAEAGYHFFAENLAGRPVPYTDGLMQENWTATHLQVAEARTKIDIAHMMLRRTADSIDDNAQSGTNMPLDERARIRADCSWAVRQCLEAVETLYIASGGRGLANSSPLQRAQRDLHAVNMHGITMLETNLDIYGKVLLGQDPGASI